MSYRTPVIMALYPVDSADGTRQSTRRHQIAPVSIQGQRGCKTRSRPRPLSFCTGRDCDDSSAMGHYTLRALIPTCETRQSQSNFGKNARTLFRLTLRNHNLEDHYSYGRQPSKMGTSMFVPTVPPVVRLDPHLILHWSYQISVG